MSSNNVRRWRNIECCMTLYQIRMQTIGMSRSRTGFSVIMLTWHCTLEVVTQQFLLNFKWNWPAREVYRPLGYSRSHQGATKTLKMDVSESVHVVRKNHYWNRWKIAKIHPKTAIFFWEILRNTEKKGFFRNNIFFRKNIRKCFSFLKKIIIYFF